MKQVVRLYFDDGEVIETSVPRGNDMQLEACKLARETCHVESPVREIVPLESTDGNVVQYMHNVKVGSLVHLVTRRQGTCTEDPELWCVHQRRGSSYVIYREGCGGFESCKRRTALGEPNPPFRVVSSSQLCVYHGRRNDA